MSLNNKDLSGTILPNISIDEYEPKAGDNLDVIVVAFHLTDSEPADDLNTFIQRGFIDTLDVEVSPNTDTDGRYLVFVEMPRDDLFPNKFQALVKDIENVAGPLDWKVKTYFSDGQEFAFNDPALYSYVIIDPAQYVPKDDFKMADSKEKIEEFFRDSFALNLTINNNLVTVSGLRHKIVLEVADVGDYDTVIGRNFLREAAYNVKDVPYEAKVLESILGHCQVLPLGKFLVASYGDKILLVKNTQLI